MKNRPLSYLPKGEKKKHSSFPLPFGKVGMGLLFMFLLFTSCNNKPKEVLGENEYYACSMDPQVLEKQAGMCPICQMPLAKITLDKSQLNIVKLNEQQMKLANVKLDTVRLGTIGKETTLSGVFTVNQNNTEQISARINGRLEKLYHRIPGEEIKKGEPAYDLYSRDLFQIQQEYLFALDKSELLGGKSIIPAARNKLLLWGLTETQIIELEKTREARVTNTIYSAVSGSITDIPLKEGDIVSEGSMIYRLADLSSLWVEAQVYTGELNMLKEGKKVEIVPDAFPEEATEGVVVFSNPELQSRSKINLVRMEVKNPGGKFKPGMQVYVIHHADEKKAIVLPVDAVIRDSKHAVVWIQHKEGGFEIRRVETGIENKFKIEIVSGLSLGEMVVTSGAYLINSEYIFKRGMMPKDEIKM